MNLVQSAREEPVLPQVPATLVHAVDVLAVAKMGTTDRPGQRVLASRRPHEVDVVAHEAVAKQSKAVPLAVGLKQFQIDPAIIVDEEHVLTIVAPLGDVVRLTGKHDSRDSRHTAKLQDDGNNVNKSVTVPYSARILPYSVFNRILTFAMRASPDASGVFTVSPRIDETFAIDSATQSMIIQVTSNATVRILDFGG